MLLARPASAEYVENGMARAAQTWILATSGTVALACDIGDVVYLAGAGEGLAGRLTLGIGSMVAGTAEVVTGGLFSIGISKSAVQGGYEDNRDSSGARDYRVATALAATNIALGTLSVGLGIATVVTSGGDEAESAAASIDWTVMPMVASPDGHGAAGALVVGTF